MAVALKLEFLLLFFVLPTLFAFERPHIPAIPVLWAVLVYCLFVMARDPGFQAARLWDTGGIRRYAPAILRLFAPAALIGTALVVRYTPENFLRLPRSNPVLWGMVMVLYPLASVYPQGVIYRAFLFTRYRGIFGPGLGIVFASAAAFAYLHIVFRNALAVSLTFPAGLLFAARYLQTGSLFVSSFEHALYGCAIFTIGLGRWFYYGSMPR